MARDGGVAVNATNMMVLASSRRFLERGSDYDEVYFHFFVKKLIFYKKIKTLIISSGIRCIKVMLK